MCSSISFHRSIVVVVVVFFFVNILTPWWTLKPSLSFFFFSFQTVQEDGWWITTHFKGRSPHRWGWEMEGTIGKGRRSCRTWIIPFFFLFHISKIINKNVYIYILKYHDLNYILGGDFCRKKENYLCGGRIYEQVGYCYITSVEKSPSSIHIRFPCV